MLSPRRLHVEVTSLRPAWKPGAPAPVVFHHGIGTNLHIFDEWLPPIAWSRDIARYDFRGFGRSVAPMDGHRWTMDELVDDVMEVASLAAGPKGRAHLVGESMGGTVVLLAAIRHPDRVASVTISNAAYKGPGINRVAGWREEIARDGMSGWADRMMDLRFKPGVLTDEKRRWFAAEQATSRAHVVLGLGELLAVQDLTAELPKLKAPLLMLMPSESPFVPLAQASELAAMVPGSRLQVFEGVRHGLPFSHGAACGEALARELERLDPGA